MIPWVIHLRSPLCHLSKETIVEMEGTDKLGVQMTYVNQFPYMFVLVKVLQRKKTKRSLYIHTNTYICIYIHTYTHIYEYIIFYMCKWFYILAHT